MTSVNKKLKILFIGTVEFSYKMLEKLILLESNVIGVCTKNHSVFNSDFVDLTPLCIQNKIPYLLTQDINSIEAVNWIKELNPDIIFCFGWSSLIKSDLLKIPKIGIIGYHPTKLPKNRGRHPLVWSLVLGLETSASTFFFIEEGADDGDILSQVDFDILYEDDAKSLYKKIIDISLNQIELFLPLLQNNNYLRIKQNNEIATIWRKRGKSDGSIDFRMSSRSIYNLVRALTKPYNGAHILFGELEVKIWKVEEVENNEKNVEYGKVLNVDNNEIIVKCGHNSIKIVDHEFKNLPKIGDYL